MTLELSLLGSFRATLAQQPLAFPTERARALLAYLAMHPDQPQPREMLATLLWPDRPDDKARNSLRSELTRIRQTVGDLERNESLIAASRSHVRLNAAQVTVDALTLQEQHEDWLRHDHAQIQRCPECIQRLTEVIVLHRGEFLADIFLNESPSFTEWMLLMREHLQLRALQILDVLIEHHELVGNNDQVLTYARRQLALQPWREQAHRQLMRTLTLNGQRSLALQQYERCREVMQTELGVEPSAETQALYEQIRAGSIAPLKKERRRLPYKGLSPFTVSDEVDFFGRSASVERLRRALAAHSMVALVGPSGSGKTSLIQAGLLPALAVKRNGRSPWQIVTMRPGKQPIHALADAISMQIGGWNRQDLISLMQEQKCHLSDVARMLLNHNGDECRSDQCLLVVVDQFEELFTLCKDGDQRDRFLDLLLGANPSARDQVVVLLALRADFMGQALAHRPLADALQEATVVLGPMDRTEMEQAIVNPARRQGIVFEPGLVARLLDDLGDTLGSLPLLEFTLTQLWDEQQDGWITHSAYERMGGLTGALTNYANGVYARLQPHEQEAARRIFLQLVQPNQSMEDTRRPATRAEIGEDWPVVLRLADARLVVTNRNADGEETAELVHEALIRAWNRLRAWLEADREFRLWQQRLRAQAEQWRQNDADPAILLRGGPLAEAERWLHERGSELSPPVRQFIEASIASRQEHHARQEALRQQKLDHIQALANAETRRAEMALRARRRLRWLATGLSVLLIFAAFEAFYAFRQQQEAERQSQIAIGAQRTAEAERARAEQERARAETNADLALSRQLAAQAIQSMNTAVDRALLLSLEALRLSPSPSDAVRLLTELDVNPLLEQVLHNDRPDPIYEIAFVADGTDLLTSDERGTVTRWDLANGEKRIVAPYSGEKPRVVAISPTGERMATMLDQEITLWDTASSVPVAVFREDDGNVKHLNFSADGRYLLVGNDRKILRQWNADTGELIGRVSAYNGNAPYTADGEIYTVIEIVDGAPKITLQNGRTGEQIGNPMLGHTDGIYDVSFSPDGTMIATASFDGTVRLWDAASGQPIGTPLRGHDGRVLFVTFHPDGTMLASGGTDGTAILWDLTEQPPVGTPLQGHNTWLRRGAFSSDGTLLATGNATGEVVLWALDRRQLLRGDHTERVRTVALSPDESSLVTNGFDRTLGLWEAKTGALLRTIPTAHERSILHGSFSPDGTTYASIDAGGGLVLWDVEEWRPRFDRLQGMEDVLIGLAFSPDGRTVATSSFQGFVALWDVASGELLREPFVAHEGWALSLEYSPDGSILASGSSDGTIRLWSTETWAPIGDPIVGHQDWVTDLLFAPDGSTLISASADHSVRFWDVASNQQRGEPITGHGAQIWGLHRVESEPPVLITVGGDGSVMWWDWETHIPMGPPLQTFQETENAAFSANGQRIYLASFEPMAQYWTFERVDPWPQQVCHIVQRNLTQEEWHTYLHDHPYRKTCPQFP